jgi:hypothetical protein
VPTFTVPYEQPLFDFCSIFWLIAVRGFIVRGMLCYSPPRSPVALELVSLEQRQQFLESWKEPTAWGGTWRDFFSLFHKAVANGQVGAQVSQLYHWSYGGERHATMSEIRSALDRAVDAGIVVRLLDNTPEGTHEYFLLEPSWLLTEIMCESNVEAAAAAPPTGHDAVQQLSSFSFDACAKRHGFQDGSSLTTDALFEFFREGPYTATDIYRSDALYPTGVERFYHTVRGFVDEVLQQGVQVGALVITKNEEGRELYGLSPGVVQLVRKGNKKAL